MQRNKSVAEVLIIYYLFHLSRWSCGFINTLIAKYPITLANTNKKLTQPIHVPFVYLVT